MQYSFKEWSSVELLASSNTSVLIWSQNCSQFLRIIEDPKELHSDGFYLSIFTILEIKTEKLKKNELWQILIKHQYNDQYDQECLPVTSSGGVYPGPWVIPP